MKKALLSFAFAALVLTASAQCDKMFISEYVVGTGNNKAYEIYNPTDLPINLDGYVMQRLSNGETTSTDETILAGTIEAYGTWVVANGQTEDIDIGGGVISPAVDPELQALADQLDEPYPAPTYMNGNDALVFVNTNVTPTEVLDIFGKPGEDPGVAWSAPDGTFITNSQTMVREFDVTQGVIQPPIEFLPLEEWDTLGTNVWTNLGIHDCACFPLKVKNRESVAVEMYPNPLTQGSLLQVKTNYAIKNAEVYDLAGRLVNNKIDLTDSDRGTIDIRELPAGTYIVNVMMENNIGFSTQIIKK